MIISIFSLWQQGKNPLLSSVLAMPRKIRQIVGNGVSEHQGPPAFPAICGIQREVNLYIIFNELYIFSVSITYYIYKVLFNQPCQLETVKSSKVNLTHFLVPNCYYHDRGAKAGTSGLTKARQSNILGDSLYSVTYFLQI